MVVKLSSISSKIKSLSSMGGGGAGGIGSTDIEKLSAQMSFLGGSNINQLDKDKVMSAVLRTIGDSDFSTGMGELTAVKFTPKIVDKKTQFDNKEPVQAEEAALKKLEGHKDTEKDVEPDPLLEVVMGGSPEAVNYTLTLLTGDDLSKNIPILEENLAVPKGLADKTKKTIEEADEKLLPGGEGLYKGFGMGIISNVLGGRLPDGLPGVGFPQPGGQFNLGSLKSPIGTISGGAAKIQSLLSSVSQLQSQIIPNLSGKLIDDLIVDIDPFIKDKLRELIGFNIKEVDRLKILTLIVQKKLDAAGELIQALTQRTDLTLAQIIASLEIISTDASKIVNQGHAAVEAIVDMANENEGSYVDSAEEMEADIGSSTRPINGLVLHTSDAADPRSDITPETAEKVLGRAFHYIMRPNGRVFRSVGLSSVLSQHAGQAAGVIHMLIMKANDNPNHFLSVDQAKSYREITKAFHRLIPGIKIAHFGELSGNSKTPIIGMNPRGVQRGITGSSDTGTGPSGENSGITANSEPPLKPYSAQKFKAGGLRTYGKMKHQLSPSNGPINAVLIKVGDELGIQCVTSSGNRTRNNSNHRNGWASDTYLYKDGIIMDAMRADQRPYVIAFTDAFYKAGGKSAGVANHVGPDPKYMGGDHYHYDVKPGVGIRWWGNRETKHAKYGNKVNGAPAWLFQVARKNGGR